MRSRQEPAIREQILAYDRWYADNQVERLLSDRLTSKASKAAAPRKRGTSKGWFQPSKAAKKDPTRSRPIQMTEDDVLDPQLSQSPSTLYTPALPDVYSLYPTPSFGQRQVPLVATKKLPTTSSIRPEASGFPIHSVDSARLDHLFRHDSHTTDNDSLMESPTKATYPDPSAIKDGSSYAEARPRSPTSESIDIGAKMGVYYGEEGSGSDAEEESECTRLKGVHWPGMAIFDSASPDARRMRNQKKDGSILEQMMVTSSTVQPIELIFNPGGSLKKKRQISGQVESSPIKEDISKPKRQRAKPKRAALQSTSTNIPQAMRTLQSHKANARARKLQTSCLGAATQAHAGQTSLSHAGYKTGDNWSRAFDDDEADWILTAGDLGPRRTHSLKIYSDNVKAVRQGSVQAQTDNPFNSEYPYAQLSKHPQQRLVHSHGLPHLNASYGPLASAMGDLDTAPMARRIEPSSRSFYHSSQSGTSENKENVEPIVDHTGRIDDVAARIGAERRTTQRYFSVNEAHPPQHFHTLPPMDFGPFHRPATFGHSLNPLTLSFQQSLPQSSSYNNGPAARAPLHVVSPRRRMTKSGGPESDDGRSGDETTEENMDDDLMLFVHEEA